MNETSSNRWWISPDHGGADFRCVRFAREGWFVGSAAPERLSTKLFERHVAGGTGVTDCMVAWSEVMDANIGETDRMCVWSEVFTKPCHADTNFAPTLTSRLERMHSPAARARAYACNDMDVFNAWSKVQMKLKVSKLLVDKKLKI